MTYLSKNNLQTHRKLPTCEVCSKQFSGKSKLKRHIRSFHTTNLRFSCNVCHKTYKYEDDLKFHIKIVHDDNAPNYECVKCDFTTKHKKYLQTHLETHDENRTKVKCEICSKEIFKECMSEHKRIHSGKFAKLPCDICGKVFPTNYKLNRHKAIHE